MLVDIKNYNSEIYFIDLCLAYLQGSKKIENIFMENKRKKEDARIWHRNCGQHAKELQLFLF